MWGAVAHIELRKGKGRRQPIQRKKEWTQLAATMMGALLSQEPRSYPAEGPDEEKKKGNLKEGKSAEEKKKPGLGHLNPRKQRSQGKK